MRQHRGLAKLFGFISAKHKLSETNYIGYKIAEHNGL